jgi:hypothetical protein
MNPISTILLRDHPYSGDNPKKNPAVYGNAAG